METEIAEKKEGLNPDRTSFDLNEILLKNYLLGKLNLDTAELNRITITSISPKDSIRVTESRF